MFFGLDIKLRCERLSTAQIETNLPNIVNTGGFMLLCMHNVTTNKNLVCLLNNIQSESPNAPRTQNNEVQAE